MKILHYLLVVVTAIGFYSWVLPIAGLKREIMIDSIVATTPREYSVIYTTITKSPQEKMTEKADDSDDEKITNKSIVITRTNLGSVGRDKNELVIRKPITIPLPEFKIETDIPEMISQVSGAVQDPRVAVAGTAGAVLLREGLNLLGSEINKAYGNDPYTLNFIELLPTFAYQVVDNNIQPTDEFKEVLSKYLELYKQHFDAAVEFNKVLKPYRTAYQKWESRDGITQSDWETIAKLQETEQNVIMPALRKRLEIEVQLEQIALHRLTLMPGVEKEGRGCQSGYQGPWTILAYKFLGAEQIDVSNISYCVNDTSAVQLMDVDIYPSLILTEGAQSGSFRAGGFQLVAKNKNILFPQPGTGQKSAYIDWATTLITDTTDVNKFLFPFDINEIRKKAAKESNKARKKQKEGLLKALEEAVKKLPTAEDKEKARKKKEAAEKAEIEKIKAEAERLEDKRKTEEKDAKAEAERLEDKRKAEEKEAAAEKERLEDKRKAEEKEAKAEAERLEKKKRKEALEKEQEMRQQEKEQEEERLADEERLAAALKDKEKE